MAEKPRITITNKRAGFEYHIVQKYVAGIILTGTEIKSLRQGHTNINEAFCLIKDGEIFIKGMHISIWKQGSYYNHEPLRTRKLLLNKSEIRKLKIKALEKGFTVIPLSVFFSDTGYAKVEIAVAQGKRNFDKREDIKKKDIARQLSRK